MLIVQGHLDDDRIVLSLRHPAQVRIIWTGRFPHATRRLLNWADRVVAAMCAAIATDRVEQARRTPLHRADPETLYIRARPAAMSLDSVSVGLALDFLREAIHRDPGNAHTQSLMGWSLAQGANHARARCGAPARPRIWAARPRTGSL